MTLRFAKKTQIAGTAVLTLVPAFAFAATSPFGGTPVLYDSGNPTAGEQLILERINRARANPGAEAARLGIGLNDGLDAGTIQNTPKPPLAHNPRILTAARLHSQWMMATNTFSHTGEGGTTAKQRMERAGYTFTGSWSSGENIAASAFYDLLAVPQYLHDNLFKSPGHRESICNASFVETGLGIDTGIFPRLSSTVPSMLVTNKFATSGSSPGPFLVGVAYYDFNDNGLYDEGESIPGVEVHVNGGTRYAVTAGAGGFAVPVPTGAATRNVAFVFGSYQETVPVAFPGGVNVKRDLRLPYQPPAISGPVAPAVGAANPYEISPVPGASAFRVRIHKPVAVLPDPAEDLSRVVVASWRATPLSTSTRYSGSAAYHLTHTMSQLTDQLTYGTAFLARAGASLSFRSRLGFATSAQVARVQVSVDGGSLWTDVFTQPGAGNAIENSFQLRNIPLDAYAGKRINLRLRYDRGALDSYYSGADNLKGWYVDDLVFTNLDALDLIGETPNHPSGAAFPFIPPDQGSYTISARPEASSGNWGEGTALIVEAVAPTPSYATWAAAAETAAGLAPGALANTPLADSNNDGLPNLVAYLLGLSAIEPSAHLAPKLTRAPEGCRMVYWYDTSAVGGSLAVEVSSDFKTWRAPGEPGFPPGVTDVASHQENGRQYRVLTCPSSIPGMFVRLRASVTNP